MNEVITPGDVVISNPSTLTPDIDITEVGNEVATSVPKQEEVEGSVTQVTPSAIQYSATSNTEEPKVGLTN